MQLRDKAQKEETSPPAQIPPDQTLLPPRALRWQAPRWVASGSSPAPAPGPADPGLREGPLNDTVGARAKPLSPVSVFSPHCPGPGLHDRGLEQG